MCGCDFVCVSVSVLVFFLHGFFYASVCCVFVLIIILHGFQDALHLAHN